ncbi:hypothetical protein PU634_10325 [Oceanimonas pelagia]|uniref:Uncharacterized protein n=1 Tax=Oceanimonas pelagia TaxID=3028314 RepID=A0AA50KJX7_9GAMM|nr:hypothetical protein [Oceanimonas pelagia]WMC09511.1 hypothetical protein PU634_10325 [Oceanimonas pelagia]
MALKKNLDAVVWAAVQKAAMTRIQDLLKELEHSVQGGMEDLIYEAFDAINTSEPPDGATWKPLSLSWNYDKYRKWGGEENAFYRGKGFYTQRDDSLHATFKALDQNSAQSGRRLYHALGGITYQMAQPHVLNAGFELRTHYVNDVNRALKNPYFVHKATGKRANAELAVNVRRFVAAASAPGVSRTENPLLRRYDGRNLGPARLLAENLVGNKPKVESFTLFGHIQNLGYLTDRSTKVLDTLDEHDTSLLGERRKTKGSRKGRPASAADKLYVGAKKHKRQLLDALMKQYLKQDLQNNVEAALTVLERNKR